MSTGTQDDDFVFGVVTRSNAQIMRDQAMHVLTEVMDFAEDEDIVLALHEHGGICLDVRMFIRPDQVTRKDFEKFCFGDHMYSVTLHVKHY